MSLWVYDLVKLSWMVLLLLAGLTHTCGGWLAVNWLWIHWGGLSSAPPACHLPADQPRHSWQRQKCRRPQAKTWKFHFSFAAIMSASILLGKASRLADPRVQGWVRFPTVRKCHTAKSHGKGGKNWATIQVIPCLGWSVLSEFISKTWYERDQKLFVFRIKLGDQETDWIKDLFKQRRAGEK